jgi:hypothetical protein
MTAAERRLGINEAPSPETIFAGFQRASKA